MLVSSRSAIECRQRAIVSNSKVAALVEEAKRRPPNIPPLPESFRHYRSELGALVYGAVGIGRERQSAT
jgi:hypothetical protein